MLTRQLARRGEWERLWRLIPQLPIGHAVEAATYFGGGWRPTDPRDQVLFDLLRRVVPDQLVAAHDALAAAGSVEIPTDLRTARQGALAGALSADGQRLAIATWPGASQGIISVFDVPGAGLAARHRVGSLAFALLAYAGDRLIVCNVRSPDHPGNRLLGEAGGRLVPFAAVDVTPHDWPITGLVSTFHPRGGFAVLCADQVTFYNASGGIAGRLHHLGEPRLPLQARVPLAKSNPALLATEPGGRLAVAGSGGFAVYDARDPRGASLLTRARFDGQTTEVRFCGPERLVTITSAGRASAVRVWRLTGDTQPELQAISQISKIRYLIVIGGRGMIAAVSRSGRIRYLDMTTLSERRPSGFPRGADVLCNSPGGQRWALSGRGFAAVHQDVHPALAVADRPVAEWTAADLATVTAALADPALPAAARPFAELVHARLEWQFGESPG